MSQVATLEGSPGFQGADFTKKDAQNAGISWDFMGISWGFHGEIRGTSWFSAIKDGREIAELIVLMNTSFSSWA